MFDKNESPFIFVIVALVIMAACNLLCVGGAWLAEQNDTRLTQEQQLMGEIQATTAALVNDARDREMDGAVDLAGAITGNGGLMGGSGGSSTDVIAILALVAVVLFMGLILFALAKKQ